MFLHGKSTSRVETGVRAVTAYVMTGINCEYLNLFTCSSGATTLGSIEESNTDNFVFIISVR